MNVSRFSLLMLLALSLCACASPQPLPRQALAPASAAAARSDVGEARIRVEAAERAAPQRAELPAVQPAPEPNPARPAAPVFRSFVETVEVPVDRVVEVEAPRPQYSRYDDYVANQRAYRRRNTTPFPVNTAIGAGVGAIIGHQRGRRGRGALIGSGVGLLLDLNRWSRW